MHARSVRVSAQYTSKSESDVHQGGSAGGCRGGQRVQAPRRRPRGRRASAWDAARHPPGCAGTPPPAPLSRHACMDSSTCPSLPSRVWGPLRPRPTGSRPRASGRWPCIGASFIWFFQCLDTQHKRPLIRNTKGIGASRTSQTPLPPPSTTTTANTTTITTTTASLTM